MPIQWSSLRSHQRDLLLLLGLALLCYADKILLGPFAVLDIYDTLEAHFAHFRSMWRLLAEYGPFSWYPFHAGGVPSFVGQHPPYHPAVLLSGLLPIWLLSLAWNIGQMFLAGYGMYRFLPLLLKTSRRTTFLLSALYSLAWISGNFHFVMSYAFPALFAWTVDLFRLDSTRAKRLSAASLILLVSLFSFPVLSLPHFPILHLALVLFLGRHLPDFRRQVAGVFLVWTGYVLLFTPTIASLFLYIPYTQREWDFAYPGFWPALLDMLRWLKGRLTDQQMLSFLLLGLPFMGRRQLRTTYAFFAVMLLVAGAFSSEMKGIFAGTFLLKMDLFMFASATGIVGVMVAGQVLDALAESPQRLRWPWLLAVVAALSLFGAANKVLTNFCILGAGLCAVQLMRQNAADAWPRLPWRALALAMCLAATAMLVRQQNMTSGMFAPYAQGYLGHAALSALAARPASEPFRVACVDVHPAILQARGLDTVGEKSPLFNMYYKEFVREAIRPQFATLAEAAAFDALWRQLYLTRTRADMDQRGFAPAKPPQRSVADFNWNALRAMNVTHVVASREMSGMEAVAGPPLFSPGLEAEMSWLKGLLPRSMYALPLWIYELKAPLPRVRLAHAEMLNSRAEVLARLGSADLDTLRTTALLTPQDLAAAGESLPLTSPAGSLPGEARIVSWSPDRLIIAGTASGPCVLVTANNFDPHWQVVEGGETRPVFRADHAFLGASIPKAGPFRLELVFKNPLIWWLHLASGLGVLLMFFGCLGPFTASRQADGSVRESGNPGQQAPCPASCGPTLPWRSLLLAGAGTGLLWAASFALFVMARGKGPQTESFGYALATIPVLGLLVACWCRVLVRRLGAVEEPPAP